MPTRPRPEPQARAIKVAYPPPPAKIEVLPLRRYERCRWLDGYWDSNGSTWVWRRGAWVVPEQDCVYSPPRTSYERTSAGTDLIFRPGEWYDPDQNVQCPDPKPCREAFEVDEGL